MQVQRVYFQPPTTVDFSQQIPDCSNVIVSKQTGNHHDANSKFASIAETEIYCIFQRPLTVSISQAVYV